MSRVLIGNVKGPKGDTGAQGIQGIQGPQGKKGDQGIQGPQGDTGTQGPKGDNGDKGDTGERGSLWYIGSGITGNSVTPTVYPNSGVTSAHAEDVYLNTTGTSRGNIYQCTLGGDASTAKWVYVGSILGAMPEVVNNLTSTSTTKALSANQGKVLKELIDNAGLEPLVVTPTLSQKTYTVALVIEDKTTTFTVTDMDDHTGTYSYTGQGGTTAIVNITIGTSIGLPQSGAIIKSIASSNARIKSYVLYNSSSTAIFSETPSLWAHITDDEQNIIPSTNITDGANTYKSGIISKIIGGVRTALYPITHAKAVWFSKTRNETVYDKIEYMDANIAPTEVSPSRNAYSVGDFLIYNNELYKVVAAIAVGESLTIGTNIEKKSTGAELSQLNSDLANDEYAIASAAAWMVYENNKSPIRKYFVVSTNSEDKWTYRGRGTTGRGNTDKVVVYVRAGLEYSQYGFAICALGTSAEAVTWSNPTSYGSANVSSFVTERGNTLYLATNNGGWQGSANMTAYGSATIDGGTYELIPVAMPSGTQYSAFTRLAEDILVYDMAYTHLAQKQNLIASDVAYASNTSGLSATNVQGAIDEIAEIKSNLLKNSIVVERLSSQVTFYPNNFTSWSIKTTKSGYTPIACSPVIGITSLDIRIGNVTMIGTDFDGNNFSISGTGRYNSDSTTSITTNLYVYVTWMKNS